MIFLLFVVSLAIFVDQTEQRSILRFNDLQQQQQQQPGPRLYTGFTPPRSQLKKLRLFDMALRENPEERAKMENYLDNQCLVCFPVSPIFFFRNIVKFKFEFYF